MFQNLLESRMGQTLMIRRIKSVLSLETSQSKKCISRMTVPNILSFIIHNSIIWFFTLEEIKGNC